MWSGATRQLRAVQRLLDSLSSAQLIRTERLDATDADGGDHLESVVGRTRKICLGICEVCGAGMYGLLEELFVLARGLESHAGSLASSRFTCADFVQVPSVRFDQISAYRGFEEVLVAIARTTHSSMVRSRKPSLRPYSVHRFACRLHAKPVVPALANDAAAALIQRHICFRPGVKQWPGASFHTHLQ